MSVIEILYDVNDSSEPIEPKIGMIFHESIGVSELAVWIGVYALKMYKTSVKRKTKYCNKRYYAWECISPLCKWIIGVHRGTKTNNLWTIRKEIEFFNLEHVNCSKNCNASVKVLHQTYSNSLVSEDSKAMVFLSSTNNTGVKFGKKKHVITHPEYNSSTKMGQDKAYRVIDRINSAKIDPFVNGFKYLPDCCNRLRSNNPGSIITLQGEHTGHDSDEGNPRFVRLFMMLHAQAVCASHCKPVISYDGGFLKVTNTSYYTIYT
jgi:hypothetical protein